MRRFGWLLVLFGLVGLLALVAVASPATAQEEPVFDLHPHLLIQRPEFVDGVLQYRSCVELAAGHAVPLHAHHEHLHFGSSGVSFGGASGHAVIPAAPFPSPFGPPVEWSNCEEFAAFFAQP
jgi:hypothetical protein